MRNAPAIILAVVVGVVAGVSGYLVNNTTTYVTETVAVETVPAVCIAALEDANELLVIERELVAVVGDHMSADATLFAQLAEDDWSGLGVYQTAQETMIADIRGLTVRVNASTYQETRDACERAAK